VEPPRCNARLTSARQASSFRRCRNRLYRHTRTIICRVSSVSILIFIEPTRQLVLGKIVRSPKLAIQELGRWSAHNDVASHSGGVWPKGLYKWSHYNPHREDGLLPGATAATYGGTGIHIFSVPGRPGMGVHAGRSIDPMRPGGKTLGCIRVPTAAMFKINQTHSADRLTHIYVGRSVEEAAIERGPHGIA